MRREITFFVIGVMIFATSPTLGWVDSPAGHNVKAKPAYVSMFKNGVALVVSEATVAESNQDYYLSPLPEATLGGFWLTWPEAMALSNIRATESERTKEVKASNLHELLEANVGHTVDLMIKDQWERFKILSFPERKDLVLVENSNGVQGLQKNWIQAIRFPDKDYIDTVQRSQREDVVAFHASESSEEPLQMTYLAKGLAWSPSYIVDISTPEKAQLSAKAVIINDLIPLENTNVELIAGFPHIEFSDVNSSFSLQSLQQFLQQLSDQDRRGRGGREAFAGVASKVMAQRVAFDRAPQPSMPSAPVSGEKEEDLYFYTLDNITLKKGERGYIPLFAGEVPYEHVYTWDIANMIDENQPRPQPQTQQQEQIVWHSLKLTNTLDSPWTTAPATTMKNGHILGQDTLNFTPTNANTQLKITQAVSVKADANEYEIERQRNATEFYHSRYDLVTVKGELELTNYKDEEIQVEITKTLSGEVQEAEGDPEIQKLATGLQSVNPRSQIFWKVDLEPGDEKTLKLEYQYTIYVRS